MSKQPNRQKCQPKVYTATEYALALHRKLNLAPEKIMDALEETSRISCGAKMDGDEDGKFPKD